MSGESSLTMQARRFRTAAVAATAVAAAAAAGGRQEEDALPRRFLDWFAGLGKLPSPLNMTKLQWPADNDSRSNRATAAASMWQWAQRALALAVRVGGRGQLARPPNPQGLVPPRRVCSQPRPRWWPPSLEHSHSAPSCAPCDVHCG